MGWNWFITVRWIRDITSMLSANKQRDDRSIGWEPEAFQPKSDVCGQFWNAVHEQKPRYVLEVGTLQAIPGVSSHSRALFPAADSQSYVRLDIAKDDDVDFVGDLHKLPADWTNKFDAFLAKAVFEHLERPWIAAEEVARVLAPGGLFLVSTHQCFPVHGYPSDFFRFSDHALRLIFEDAGLIVDAVDYEGRSAIIPPNSLIPGLDVRLWNQQFPSYILVHVTGHKRLTAE